MAVTTAAVPLPALSTAVALREGGLAFLALLPVVWLVNLGWQGLLGRLDIPAPPQDLVALFARSGDTPSLVIMVVLAVVIAPLTEEMVFRIGLFRWIRTCCCAASSFSSPQPVLPCSMATSRCFCPSWSWPSAWPWLTNAPGMHSCPSRPTRCST